MSETYFIDIRRLPAGWQQTIHRGDPERPLATSTPALGRDTSIAGLVGEPGTLGGVTDALHRIDRRFLLDIFDERAQLEVGRHLYAQTLGQLEQPPPAEAKVEVHIVTDDEDIARLPWTLLARGGLFLAACGWSVTLARPERRFEAHASLPPSPKILVAAPLPTGVKETHAAAHLEELEQRLAPADRHFERGDHLRVATTWDEVQALAREFEPDIFYYYGHGSGNERVSRLVFANGEDHQRCDVSLADVAQCLRRAGRPPVLAYINCCHGDAGGLLGVGWQLGEVVPAVVTNRTLAFIDAARHQALHFWHATLIEGQPPHRAVAEIYGHLGSKGLSFRDARWMTPALHRHYARWEAHPPKPRHRIADLNWHVKIDRVQQFGQVVFQTQKMLRNRKPPCLAYLWYGQEGQGVDHFHQRLKVELREFLDENHLYEVRPRWPDELSNPYRSFEDMMLEAFEVESLDQISGRLRSQTRGESGRDIVVYARHEPLRKGEVMRPEHLRAYLEWWDDAFIPQLRPTPLLTPAFGLLGISFVVSNPARFLQKLKREEVEEAALGHLVFDVLDEMERLVKKDLLNFLHTHNIILPRDHKDRILDDILATTSGQYEMTLQELRKLVHQAWDEREAKEQAGGEAETEIDDW